MKRLFCLILSALTLLSLFSCAPAMVAESQTAPATEEAAGTEEKKETGEIVYPEGFSVGYARGVITPSLPVMLGSHTVATTKLDDLYATCIAISDGETAALLFAMDTKDVPAKIFQNCTKQIEKAVGIPSTHVIMNGTHTHNCPHTTSTADPACIQWHQKVYKVTAQLAEEALRDLAPAEIYTGKGDTAGFAHVRRYVMADGSYKGIHSANPATEYAAPESIADPELRTVRFERDGKKDIVMVNWQCHAASSGSAHRTAITADFIQPLREGVEKELDSYFAYFNGGSGNIGSHKSNVDESKFETHMKMGEALVDVVATALKGEKKAASGKVSVQHSDLPGNVIQDSEERRAQAKEYSSTEESKQGEVLTKYGFPSEYEAIAINMRSAMEPVTPIPLTVIGFGDVAVAANPFEMFDTDARAIREGSPYAMTFVCGYSLDSLGYLPSSEAFPHGEYEVYVTRFVQGTSDQVVAESIRLLNESKK